MLYNANTSEKRERYFLDLICLIWGVDGGGGGGGGPDNAVLCSIKVFHRWP